MLPYAVLSAVLAATLQSAAPARRDPAADGRCHTNVATFEVPYRFENAPAAASLLKPALYYSTDQGAHWKLGAVDLDGQSPVTFTAPGEGEYWLRMGLRRLGETGVPDFGRDRAGVLVVVVDLSPPAVRLVPRLLDGDSYQPALGLTVALEPSPLAETDVAIEVLLPASDDAPAERQLWIDRAVAGREYEWLLDPRNTLPVAFRAVAVDQAGNVASDTLEMSVVMRQPEFRRLSRPEIVRPRVVRAPGEGQDAAGLVAVVEYTVDGPALRPDEVVELWATADEGRTWQRNAVHTDRSQPLLFQAPRPGLYGLQLVLRRGERLIGEAPAEGLKPQLYVVVERDEAAPQIVRVGAGGQARVERPAGANEPADLSGTARAAKSADSTERSAPLSGSNAGMLSPDFPGEAPAPATDAAALADAAYQRGNYLRLQGRWEEARSAFLEALRHDPGLFAAHNDLAGVCFHLGRLDEAIAAYYRAIDLRPRDADARFNLARTLIRAARFDDALAQLDQVVRLNPGDGEAWLYRGELLLSRSRDVAAARAAWQKALALAPAHAGWSALARRRLAEHPDPQ